MLIKTSAAAAMDSSKQNGFCANVTKPRDCGDILSLGSTSSGVYTVFVGNKLHPISVYCDMETDNGGWTVNLFNGTSYLKF